MGVVGRTRSRTRETTVGGNIKSTERIEEEVANSHDGEDRSVLNQPTESRVHFFDLLLCLYNKLRNNSNSVHHDVFTTYAKCLFAMDESHWIQLDHLVCVDVDPLYRLSQLEKFTFRSVNQHGAGT